MKIFIETILPFIIIVTIVRFAIMELIK